MVSLNCQLFRRIVSEEAEEADEDSDYDDEGNFVVLGGGGGIKEDIALTLGTDPDIDSIWDEKLYKNLS
mgnify:CR=1 FL=1